MKKILPVFMILAMMFIPTCSYGATLNSSVSTAGSVDTGKNFTVTVRFSAGSLDYVDAELEYNENLISYISGGSSSGDSGIVFIKEGTSDGRSLSVKLKFKAKRPGSSALALSVNEAYSMDGTPLDTPGASASVKVSKPQSSQEPAAEEPQASEPEPDEADSGGTVTEPQQDPEPQQQTEQETEEDDNGNIIWYAAAAISLALLIAVIILLAVRKRRRK